jgi:hypothetical protein
MYYCGTYNAFKIQMNAALLCCIDELRCVKINHHFAPFNFLVHLQKNRKKIKGEPCSLFRTTSNNEIIQRI